MDGLQAALTLVCGGVTLWFLFWWRSTEDKRKFRKRRPGIADEPVTYNIKSGQGGPVLSGVFCTMAVRLLNSIVGRLALKRMFMRKGNMFVFRDILMVDTPTMYPLVTWEARTKSKEEGPLDLDSLLSRPMEGQESAFHHKGLHYFYQGYRSGQFTPSDVAERAIAAIERSESMEPKLRAFVEFDKDQIREAARESTERFASKTPLSVLDGIPIGIKDEIRVASYHLRLGSNFLGHTPSETDSEAVRRLRVKGALILGVTNMQENGMGTSGINISKYHGTARNPYNVNHFTGGSSSGSAAAVGAGLCPVAIGTDGGGSVRLPAAFCGVVGFKPTFGRITCHGSPVPAYSVGCKGPLCATVRDAAITYAMMAGPFELDELSQHQPPVDLAGFNEKDLKGLRLGIDWAYFRDADPEIVSCCEKAVHFLKSRGAEIVAVQLPELEEARVAHIISILCEMRASLQEAFWNHYDKQYFENAILQTMAEALTVTDYVQAQQQKTRTIGFLKDIFKKVDVILSPASAILPPEIKDKYLSHGFSNTALTADSMRHVFLANLTGIPGLTVPIGYSAQGLPISLQIMGPWWQDSMVLRVGRITEEFLQPKNKPQVYFDILD